MNITDVRVRPVNSSTKLRARASITIDNCFVIHDIKVIESDRGTFIAMPSRKDDNGQYVDIAHPINANAREVIQNAVLEAYNNLEEE